MIVLLNCFRNKLLNQKRIQRTFRLEIRRLFRESNMVRSFSKSNDITIRIFNLNNLSGGNDKRNRKENIEI